MRLQSLVLRKSLSEHLFEVTLFRALQTESSIGLGTKVKLTSTSSLFPVLHLEGPYQERLAAEATKKSQRSFLIVIVYLTSPGAR